MQFIKILKRIGVHLTIFCLIFMLIVGLPITDTDSYVTATPPPLMRIIFDNTHNETKSTTDEYKNAVELLDNKGYLVNESTEIHTDLSIVLLNCDVFVVTSPRAPFHSNETKLIETFVAQGGNLFLLGDYESNSTLVTSINSLSEQFGIYFNNIVVEDPNNNDGRPYWPIITHFSEHPIVNTTDVQKIALYNATSISGGTPIALTDPDAYPSNSSVLVASKYGKGKIVAIGDSDLFNNENINKRDAKGLFLSIFGWFVLEVSQFFVGTTAIVQGDSVELILEIESLQNRSDLFIRVVGEGFETYEEALNLTVGSNRIPIEIQSSLVPYTFGERTLKLLILYKPHDFNRNILYKAEFIITINIPIVNLVIGYVLPFILLSALFIHSSRNRPRNRNT